MLKRRNDELHILPFLSFLVVDDITTWLNEEITMSYVL